MGLVSACIYHSALCSSSVVFVGVPSVDMKSFVGGFENSGVVWRRCVRGEDQF